MAARDSDDVPLHGVGRRDGGDRRLHAKGDDHTGRHAFAFAAGLSAGEMDKIHSMLLQTDLSVKFA